ncbi:MAG: hypothetical protein A2X42_02285 [Candidatus Margulisbacteria bacterium GWF2_38_17]|nr:MAG: hypothetical protein A2X43_09480 [Candidatus Margulisbacteria bacterium GWD2_39_127]OGI02906.1 MAG: hypothetical protein A2X42_02285 [Candidatus Margulisbacteria bacterium GWF2_38_17]OGI09665.1 MAG: hypothetical protein A2X41_04995 [Candidatus Margulisbacteria bacterium GWE2_39_32]
MWENLKIPIIALISSFLGGAAGYKLLFSDQSWNHIFFMTGITLSTVGYGDILNVQNNPVAIWYTIILLVIGMGIVLYSVSAVSAFLIEGHLNNLLLINSIKRKILKMKNHYVICGAGETGIHVIREMHINKKNFVVIDSDQDKFKQLREEFPRCLVIIGDATSDAILEEANIKHANSLVTTLANDKDNLFLAVTARMLNPEIQIVSTATELSMNEKLQKAGANYIVSPNYIGGMRIASHILRPNVVSFLDRMLYTKEESIRVEEVVVPEHSSIAGKTFSQTHIHEKTGLNIIAYSSSEDNGNYRYNPPDSTILTTGSVLLFIGTIEQQKKLEHLVK